MSTHKVESPGSTDAIIARMAQSLGVKRDYQIADRLGISRNTISNWRARGTVPLRECLEISERYGISMEWLVSSRGPMRRPEHWGYSEVGVDELGPPDQASGPEYDPEFVKVPVYGVEFAAGYGRVPEDERVVKHHKFHRYFFKKWGVNPDKSCIVRISGDSMEDKLSDGDHALIDMSDREIISGKAYAFRLENELLVKYLQRVPGGIQASSHNQDQYPPFIIPKEELGNSVEIIGRLRDHNHTWD